MIYTLPAANISPKDTFALLLISAVTHPLYFISPLTGVALSEGVRASRELCVRLPSRWGIACRSSNAGCGSVIKAKVKEKRKWGGGSKWEEETEMHLSQGWISISLLFCAHTKTGGKSCDIVNIELTTWLIIMETTDMCRPVRGRNITKSNHDNCLPSCCCQLFRVYNLYSTVYPLFLDLLFFFFLFL